MLGNFRARALRLGRCGNERHYQQRQHNNQELLSHFTLPTGLALGSPRDLSRKIRFCRVSRPILSPSRLPTS